MNMYIIIGGLMLAAPLGLLAYVLRDVWAELLPEFLVVLLVIGWVLIAKALIRYGLQLL